MLKKPIEIAMFELLFYTSLIFSPCLFSDTLVSFNFSLEVYFTSLVESGSIWDEQAENGVWVLNAPREERLRLEGALGRQLHIAVKARADLRAPEMDI